MKCPRCGAEMNGNVCSFCGEQLPSADPAMNQQAYPNQPQQNDPYQSQNTNQQNASGYDYGYTQSWQQPEQQYQQQQYQQQYDQQQYQQQQYQQPYQQPQYQQYQQYQQPEQQKEKWYTKTWVIVLFLLFFWPVGLFLMWKYKKNWGKAAKIIVTVLIALCVLGSCASNALLLSEVGSEDSTSGAVLGDDTDLIEDFEFSDDTTDDILEESDDVDALSGNYTTFKEGMYKVGSDIPAGEYVLFATNSGYFSINSDSSGEFDSIIANGNFDYNSIITIQDGQYLELERAYAIPLSEQPEVKTTGEGMFKVGLHIQPGEYKLVSDDDEYEAYVEVTSDSKQDFEGIVSNDMFSGSSYITVKEGQYLILERCHIEQ